MNDADKPDIPPQVANAIAAAIHEGINRSIPLNARLWTLEDVARYLNRSVSSVRQRVVCLPDFPRAFRLPSEQKTTHRLYKAAEVIEWVEKYRDTDRLPKKRAPRRFRSPDPDPDPDPQPGTELA